MWVFYIVLNLNLVAARYQINIIKIRVGTNDYRTKLDMYN